MIALATAIFLTLSISAFCSLLEAILLSTTTAEIEKLKKTHHRRGHLMDRFKKDIEETSSAILALNTIANTLGAVVIGGLAISFLGESNFVSFSFAMTLSILLVSEIIPKNVGVLYRKPLLKHFVYPVYIVRAIMLPLSWFCKKIVRLVVPHNKEILHSPDEEIILLAEKSAKEGKLTKAESDIISNALRLDDVQVSEIMTPSTVVTTLEKTLPLSQVFKRYTNIPFARIPVYQENIDNIVGLVRRRDILEAEEHATIADIMQPVDFIPETASGANALQLFLKKHQQLVVVVDEFGSTAGVITMEDVFEHILGKEIFETDDVAIDMRELARRKKESKEKQQHPKKRKKS